MSIFGFVSLFIVVVSVAVIVLHYRLMRRRAPVDFHFDRLEELLRQWIEDIYIISPAESDLHSLCDYSIDLESSDLLSIIPEINDAFTQTQGDRVRQANPQDEPQPPDQIKANINHTINALNQAIAEFNIFITKHPPAILMAKVLGLEAVEPVQQLFERNKNDEEDAPEVFSALCPPTSDLC